MEVLIISLSMHEICFYTNYYCYELLLKLFGSQSSFFII